jgi:hypothetical protein
MNPKPGDLPFPDVHLRSPSWVKENRVRGGSVSRVVSHAFLQPVPSKEAQVFMCASRKERKS